MNIENGQVIIFAFCFLFIFGLLTMAGVGTIDILRMVFKGKKIKQKKFNMQRYIDI